jgi:SPP1 gp7 family putative phage head morphogenesis protein
MGRYQALLAQAREQIAGYEGYATQTIIQGQLEWGRLGVEQAATAIAETFKDAGVWASFNRLPVSAVERMVGLAGDGSPLFDVLKKRALYPHAVEGLTNALVEGVARGWNPKKTASRMQDGLAAGYDKALEIARTEQLRVYRTASQDQYRASGVVTGYRRLSAHDDRVCAGCLAADGEECDPDLDFEAHVCCRCVAVPIVEGVDPPEWTAGGDWFEQQDEATQRHILRPGRYELWANGAVSDFRAFATHTRNDTWGGAVVPTPLSALGG